MKTICLYFEIHQIVHLKRYRFFDIGADHYYYDDYENDRSIADIVDRSYMPALNTIGEMIKEHGDYFKVAFSLSGVGMEQLELHAPKVLDKLQELNQTGCVEFLAEPYSHGLSSLKDEQVFRDEVKLQAEKIKEYFGQEPKIFRNSGLIYKDEIGEVVADMGFKGLLTEGAQHVLGWKSPHYLYHCALNPNLKLLLRDYTLSDDIALRFSNSDWEEYPLFADNYIDKIAKLPEEEQLVNIFMNLSAIGISQPISSGILEFLRALPECARKRGITFSTPTEVCMKLKSTGEANVPVALSWMDEERASNNFRMMSTKQSNVGVERGIFSSPFDAFSNYMNILGDFLSRVRQLYPESIEDDELNSLLTTIRNQSDEIELKDKEASRLQARVEKLESENSKLHDQIDQLEEEVKSPAKETAKGSRKGTTKGACKESTKASKETKPKAAPKTARRSPRKKATE